MRARQALIRVRNSAGGQFLRAGHLGSLAYAMTTKRFIPISTRLILAVVVAASIAQPLATVCPWEITISVIMLGRKNNCEQKFDSVLRGRFRTT